MTRRFFALLCFLSFALPSFAQSVKLPETVAGIPGEWIVVPFEVDGGAPKVRLESGLSEVNLAALLGPAFDPSKATGRVVKAIKPGRYKFEAWNAKGDKPSDIAVCVVIVGDAPPSNPPPDKPPVVTGKYYFLIVRPDGSARQDYVAYLGNPGWAQLTAAGHQFKDYTASEAAAYGVRFGTAAGQAGVDVPFGTQMPFILTLSTDGGKARIVRGPVALPAPTEIINLPNGVSK